MKLLSNCTLASSYLIKLPNFDLFALQSLPTAKLLDLQTVHQTSEHKKPRLNQRKNKQLLLRSNSYKNKPKTMKFSLLGFLDYYSKPKDKAKDVSQYI